MRIALVLLASLITLLLLPLNPLGNSGNGMVSAGSLEVYGYYFNSWQDPAEDENSTDFTNMVFLMDCSYSYSRNEWISWAYSRGLKPVCSLMPYFHDLSRSESEWRTFLTDLRNSLGANADKIWAFYLFDEPEGAYGNLNRDSQAKVSLAVNLTKEYFPNVNTMVVIYNPDSGQFSVVLPLLSNPNLDILATDPYFLTADYEKRVADAYACNAQNYQTFERKILNTFYWIKSGGSYVNYACSDPNNWPESCTTAQWNNILAVARSDTNKKILLIGQSFKCRDWPWNTTNMPSACQQQWYYDYAKLDPDIIGHVWFMYSSPSLYNQYLSESFPCVGVGKTVPDTADILSSHMAWGMEVLCNNQELKPFCGSNGVGYRNPDQAKCMGKRVIGPGGSGNSLCDTACGADALCSGRAPGTSNCNSECKYQGTGTMPVLSYYGFEFGGKKRNWYMWNTPVFNMDTSPWGTIRVPNPDSVIGPEPWRRDVMHGHAGDYPLIGPYEALDTEIMRWHIRLAKAAGIEGFVVQGFPLLTPFGLGLFASGNLSVNDIELTRTNNGLYMLESWGGFHASGDAKAFSNPGYETYKDKHIDSELTPTGNGAYFLDRSGNVYISGDARNFGVIGFPDDRARKIKVTPTGNGIYIMDKFGNIYTYGDAKTFSLPTWVWDIARDIEITPDGNGIYLLDGYGGVHRAGNAPAFSGAPYFGWDIARDMELVVTGGAVAGYYVLDGYGGVHKAGNLISFSGLPYWPNLDIAKDIEITSDGQGIYLLDGFGNRFRDGVTSEYVVHDPRKDRNVSSFYLDSTDMQMLHNLFYVAEQENFKIVLGDIFFTTDGLPKSEKQKKFDFAVKRNTYILSQFTSSPAYFSMDNKPVFNPVMIWDYYNDFSAFDPNDVRNYLNSLETRLGKDMFVIADYPQEVHNFGMTGAEIIQKIQNSLLTSAWSNAGIDSFVSQPPNALTEAAQASRLTALNTYIADSHAWGLKAGAWIMPGYDETQCRQRTPSPYSIPRENGGRWREIIQAVKQTHPDFVMIQRWDEWCEGSQIEPSLAYANEMNENDPYTYLKILAEELGKTWATPPLPPAKSIEPLRRKIFYPQFAADLNDDADVNIFDLAIVTAHFGLTPANSDWNPTADVVANSEIDVYDMVFVAGRFT